MNENNKSALTINFWFLLAAAVVIFISSATTFTLFAKANGTLNKKIAETIEANRPANLDLVILTDQNCKDCFDIKTVLNQLEQENIKINSNKSIDSASDEGKQLVAQFAIKKLPTFLAKGELDKNNNVKTFFSKSGNINDDTFVFRQVGGPYVDTETGKVKGRVSLTLLTDITCTQCYDVTQHEIILKQFGMQPNAKVLDISSAEGKALKNKYGINLLPTFVLSGDINEYPSFKSVWPQVGIVAKDGAYIFTTGVPFMGIHKNLSANKIITPSSNSQQ